MARKYMYVSIGILALMGVFHLGAQYGHAGFVDHQATGIVAVSEYPRCGNMLLDNGQVWFFHDGGPSWEHRTQYDLPVAVSQLKFWLGETAFVTVSNDVWYFDSATQAWVNFGPPPGVVSTLPSTWGSIKARF